MEIFVNGVAETESAATIAEMVARRGLTPVGLVVELNQEIIKQEQWPVTRLQAGDRLELLNFVGGG